MNNLRFDVTDPEFILKRIVLVNSGGHAYSEILLDDHMAMFGSNNVGKTASLAATKLLLFPENSLTKCESKFRFEGDKGHYKGEESHKFYFPTDVSFLALEVENPSGPFCMVLYKPSASSATTRLDYNRVFIPKPYSALRALFWDQEKADFSMDLSVAAVLEYSKKHHGKQVSEVKRLTEIMFGSFGTADGQFCILPLKDCGTESIKAFRDIFNLAFAASNAEKVILPSAIAALIEMQRGRDEERLNSTLNEEYENFLALEKKRDELENREMHADRFTGLCDDYKAHQQHIKLYSKQYHAIVAWLNNAQEQHEPRLQSNAQKLNLAVAELNTAQQRYKQLNEEFISKSSQLELKTRDLQKHLNQIQHCEALMGRYPEHDLDLILKLHQIDLADISKTLDALSTKEKNKILLQDKVKQREDKRQRLEHLNRKLAQQSALLMNQISPHSRQIFEILNPQLNRVLYRIDAEDQYAIQMFTQLFSVRTSAGSVYFKKSCLEGFIFTPFDAEKTAVQLASQQTILMNEFEKLDTQIAELDTYLMHADNKAYTANEQRKLSRDLEDCKIAIRLLESYKVLNHQLPEIQQECETLTTIKAQLTHELQQQQQLYEIAQNCHGELYAIQQQLHSRSESFAQIIDRLKKATLENLLCLDHQRVDLPEAIQQLPQGHHEILQCSNRLLDDSIELSRKHHKFENKYKSFLNDVYESSIEVHVETPSMQTIETNINIYKNIFATLAFQRRNFSNAVIRHNKAIRAQIDEIGDAREQLNRQINLINQKLNGHRISNLSNIKLNLETRADFDALNHTLTKFNISGDTLPDADFYSSLLNFFKNNQNSSSGRLKMESLIKSVSYQYCKNDGRIENASQSKGTTNTINAFVLSILLSEIKQADMKVHLPIIVDEIAALDAANSRATITQVSEQGFSIFCATPEFNAHIAECVGRHIFIDQNRPRKVMIDSCQLHILPQHVNHFGLVEEKHEA